jgi:wyosine [tRNA(Phe)-imidazoG37] synthetase (radical SAM superfamily)
VRGIIAKIDMPVFKLDAGAEVKFKEINRPARGIDFDEIVNLLSSLQEIYIQTVLVQGTPSNVGKEDIASYFQQLSRIQPQEAQIYSIDRPVPKAQIRLVPPKRLEQIALQGQKETGVKIKSFYLR